MSALPLKADIDRWRREVCFGPKPDKVHCSNNGLFDHLVGQRKQSGRHVKTEGLRGLTVNDEFDLGRLQDR
jgi:hypothetical protein